MTGRVFNVRGGHISVAGGWIADPSADKHGRWDAAKLTDAAPKLAGQASAARAGIDGREKGA